MDKIDETIERLRERLNCEGLKVVIIPHISPDGDAVGSCAAMADALGAHGIAWNILTCDYVPDYLRFLRPINRCISYQDKPKECEQLIAEADLIFMLDHNTVKREGVLEPFVSASSAERVIIDHHPDPDDVHYVISAPQMSSTCELLYTVICRLWGRESITRSMANALYAGINTDTGGLSHNSSRPETYRVVADLLELKLDKDYVHQRIYQMNSYSRLRLIGYLLLHKMKIVKDLPVAVISITADELERFRYRDGDLEGLVNLPLSARNISVSVQVTERKERIKLSFRSKKDIPVNEWAKAFFNGGGHLNAAGGQMDLPLDEVVKKVYKTAQWFCDTYQLKH